MGICIIIEGVNAKFIPFPFHRSAQCFGLEFIREEVIRETRTDDYSLDAEEKFKEEKQC